MTNPDRPSDVGVDQVLERFFYSQIFDRDPDPDYQEIAKQAILQWHRQEMLAEVLALIGEDESIPTRYGKKVSTSQSAVSFQKYYRNKLRAQLREAAVRLWGDKSGARWGAR